MRRRATRGIEWTALTLLGVALALPALVASEPKDARKVRVSVVVILASEAAGPTDPKLECVAKEIRKSHPKLKSFSMKTLGCRSVPIGVRQAFELVEGAKVDVTIEKACSKMDRLQLRVGPPRMGDVVYSTPCGKFLPIMTPHKTAAGETLILAVRVQPCEGK